VDPVETEYPDESQILFNGKASEDGSYKVDVADILEDGTTLVMKPDNGAEQATEYTLTIKSNCHFYGSKTGSGKCTVLSV